MDEIAATAAPRHFLDIAALPSGTLRAILDEAVRRKAARAGRPKAAPDPDAPLAGHMLASLFAHPSTRTRVSLDMAMRQLGGQAMELQGGALQTGRGESFADTAQVLSRYVDLLAFRAVRHAHLEELAGAASVPVINALTDRSHPCQTLADVMTVQERLGRLEGVTLAWLGDGNNVLVSLIEAAPVFGFRLKIACPPERQVAGRVVELARQAGARIDLTDSAADAVAGAQAVYTDTWVSMGDSVEGAEALFAAYRVTEALMQTAAAGAIFLHCLPAHRGQEVDAGVLDGPQSAVWDQAENRLHAQKAILLYCLGKLA